MIVDVHAHYYPADYLDRIGRPGLAPVWAALGRQSIDERLGLLDRTGIDAQVLSVSQAQPYLADPSAAAEAASLANDLYADLCQAYPGRFFSFAALPLPHISESLAEIARATSSPSVVGVTIGCSVAGRQLDDPVFDPVFADLDRRGARVLLHPVGHEDRPWLTGHNLAWLVGAPFEDTVAALRLVFADVPDRYPGIRFIIPHAGGTLPFLQARLARMAPADIIRGLRTMYYDTVCGSAEAMVHACHVFGAGRMLFGTDYPYCDEQQFAHHLAYLDECDLDPGTLGQVRGGTAEALLGLSEWALAGGCCPPRPVLAGNCEPRLARTCAFRALLASGRKQKCERSAIPVEDRLAPEAAGACAACSQHLRQHLGSTPLLSAQSACAHSATVPRSRCADQHAGFHSRLSSKSAQALSCRSGATRRKPRDPGPGAP